MKKLILFVLLGCSLAFAQNTTTDKTTTPPQAQQSAPAPGAQGMHGNMPMGDMAEFSKKLHADVDALRAAIDKMQEGPARDAELQNLKLWQSLVAHLDEMAQHMSHHDMMMNGGMSGMHNMHHGTTGNSTQPPVKKKTTPTKPGTKPCPQEPC